MPRMFKNLIPISILLLTPLLTQQAAAMGRRPLPSNSLAELSANHDLSKPNQDDKKVILTGPKLSLIFHHGSRRLIFNNTLILMNGPLTVKSQHSFLTATDTTETVAPLLMPEKLLSQYQPIRSVILDPGHGGADPGAIGKAGVKEKDVVFDIATRCQKKLNAMGIKAVITRKKNRNLSLKERPRMANKLQADLFVSIHANSSRNRAAKGIETHILPAVNFPSTAPSSFSKTACAGNSWDKMNVLLAYSIQKSALSTTSAADRGVRRSRFSVLRNATCPAILIECGFLSNKVEEKNLNNPAYRDKIATGIANGIKELVNLQ